MTEPPPFRWRSTANDLSGAVFGRLLALEPTATRIRGGVAWLCECDCSAMVLAEASQMRRGFKKSCGCLQAETQRTASIKHGLSATPEYASWRAMRHRCLSPDNASYEHYGARGITVCPEWGNDFEAFLAHVGPRPGDGYSLDRIDNDGNYEPGNVRWATRSVQRRNRRLA